MLRSMPPKAERSTRLSLCDVSTGLPPAAASAEDALAPPDGSSDCDVTEGPYDAVGDEGPRSETRPGCARSDSRSERSVADAPAVGSRSLTSFDGRLVRPRVGTAGGAVVSLGEMDARGVPFGDVPNQP